MNTLLFYMFKAALYLSAFYFIYSILLSRDTSYVRNRAFIISSLAVALILPAIRIHTIMLLDIQFLGKYLPGVFITASSGKSVDLSSEISASTLLHILNIVYLTGAAVITLKLVSDLINIIFLIIRQKNNGSRIIRFHGFNTAGFSAMGYVFVNTRLSQEETADVIKHEQNHLKRHHFIDILFIGIIKAFQWFNPTIYLFNRSLRAIHEYQADQECLTSGISVVNYQTLLLNQVLKTNYFTLSNSFSNPSLVKKRMIMMTKKRTPSLAAMKLLFVIPVVGFVFLLISSFGEITSSGQMRSNREVTEAISEDAGAIPFAEVEEMPVFPGGDAALLKYIGEHTNYPENAKKNNVQGRVVIRFCVTEKGRVNKISVLEGDDPDLNSEAIRVAGTLPDFRPGRQSGKAVPVWYMVPITFALK